MLDISLGFLTFVLVTLSIVAVPLIAAFLTSRGPIDVPVRVDPPYAIDLSGDRTMEVASAHTRPLNVNFGRGAAERFSKSVPTVTMKVHVARADTDSRLVVSGFVVALLIVGWFGLVSLRRVVTSALAGDPFDRRNVARLRVLALCIATVPLITEITSRILGHTLDVDPSVSPVGASNWWMYVVAALGVLALAEIFRAGESLRELERRTI